MKNIQSVLIANRGEIAVRIIRSAKALGLRTIAVYSEADAGAPHVKLADDSVCIGPPPVSESYLCVANILEAAAKTGAQAVHPGYGFLSENAAFAEACATAGLVFVGPGVEAIRLMGDKAAAKKKMIEAGVPCVPGYQGDDQTDAALIVAADRIGFPVMVKATMGGGGRGIRLVHSPSELSEALGTARSEAKNAFGDGALIIEKAVIAPRHVEIQVFADAHGNFIHLGERDCSVQRRHQKVVEEAPGPAMNPELRAAMGAAAVEAARSIAYRGAGTVEFLLDAQLNFYFLEMNTRLQVEHPVTEMITGLDLVAMQFRVADGQQLGIAQDDVRFNGHAIEVRLYAEDPANGFLPAAGRVDDWAVPSIEGVRVDSGIVAGQSISPFYDPMIAKVIAHASNRDEACAKLASALKQVRFFGLPSNLGFLIDILERPTFLDGAATTAFIGEQYGVGYSPPPATADIYVMAAALEFLEERDRALARAIEPMNEFLGWSSGSPITSYIEFLDGKTVRKFEVLSVGTDPVEVGEGRSRHICSIVRRMAGEVTLRLDGAKRVLLVHRIGEQELHISESGQTYRLQRRGAGGQAESQGGDGRIVAPMHGVLIEMRVAKGDRVEAGDKLAMIEAMKMQHEIKAPVSGIVSAVLKAAGNQVADKALLIEITPNEAA
jgi:geranyl-CoA carboxylase alpha subunit